jgi:hypothetical protein
MDDTGWGSNNQRDGRLSGFFTGIVPEEPTDAGVGQPIG